MPPAELVIKGLKKGDRSREEDPVLSHSSGTLAHMGTIGTVHDFKSFNRLRAIAVKSRNQNQNSNNSNNNNNNNVNNNSISIGSNINGRSSGNSTTNINNSTSTTSGAALNSNNQKQMQQMKQMNNTLNNKLLIHNKYNHHQSSRGQIKLNENTRDSMNAKFGSLLRGIQPVSIVKLRQQHDLGSFTDPVHR